MGDFNPDFYHASVCNRCKTTSNLRRCGNCKSVSYCSKECQKADWLNHKEICKVCSQVDNTISVEDQNKYRGLSQYYFILSSACSDKLGRSLTSWEYEMLAFRKCCTICSKRYCTLGCQNCLSVFYCTMEHQNSHAEKHKEFCAYLKLNFELLQLKYTTKIPLPTLTKTAPMDKMNKLPENLENLVHMLKESTFLIFPIEISGIEKYSIVDQFAPLANIIFGLEKADMIKNRVLFKQELVLHLVGASNCEASWNWDFLMEFLFHWISNLKKLCVVLIGPEIQDPCNYNLKASASICDTCKTKQINGHCVSKSYLYHEVAHQLDAPDMIVAFNCGFFTYSSWLPSISMLTKYSGVPLILTEFYLNDARTNVNLVKVVKEIDIIVAPQKNPFGNISPVRNPVETQPVYFKNAIITILKPKY